METFAFLQEFQCIKDTPLYSSPIPSMQETRAMARTDEQFLAKY